MQLKNIYVATNERRKTAVASETGADLSVAAAAVFTTSIKYLYIQKLLLQLVL